MKPPQDVSVVKTKLTKIQDGKLVFSTKKEVMSVPPGFPINAMFLSEWVGRKVSVLLVDGVAVQLKRTVGLVRTVKYPRDV